MTERSKTTIKSSKLKPDYSLAYFNRGNSYRNKGFYDRAILDYDKVIERKPDDAYAYTRRGYVYALQGAYDRALKDYDQAIELNPDFVENFFTIDVADYADYEHLYDQEIQDYSRTITLRPADVEALFHRGLLYALKRFYDQAHLDLDAVTGLEPDSARGRLAQRYRDQVIRAKAQQQRR